MRASTSRPSSAVRIESGRASSCSSSKTSSDVSWAGEDERESTTESEEDESDDDGSVYSVDDEEAPEAAPGRKVSGLNQSQRLVALIAALLTFNGIGREEDAVLRQISLAIVSLASVSFALFCSREMKAVATRRRIRPGGGIMNCQGSLNLIRYARSLPFASDGRTAAHSFAPFAALPSAATSQRCHRRTRLLLRQPEALRRLHLPQVSATDTYCQSPPQRENKSASRQALSTFILRVF